MVCAGVHTSISRKPDVNELIAQLQTLECRHLCNSGILGGPERTVEAWRKSIPYFNEMGRRLRDVGVAFHCHNHDYEFDDLGWVHVAGRDPAAFLAEHREQVVYLHLKDYERTG